MVCIKGVSQWRRIAAILNHLSILILKNVLSEDVTEVAGLRKNYFIFKKILTEIKNILSLYSHSENYQGERYE